MRFLLIDRAIQEEGSYVYNMHNIVEKHISISIAIVQSRGGSLVSNKYGSLTRNKFHKMKSITT
jgi:hypothetical protein